MEEAIKGNWSVRQLERQISTCLYSRVVKNIGEVEKNENVEETTTALRYDPNTVIKDPYIPTEEELKKVIDEEKRLIEEYKISMK